MDSKGFAPLNGDSDLNNNAVLIMEMSHMFNCSDWLYLATGGGEGTIPKVSAIATMLRCAYHSYSWEYECDCLRYKGHCAMKISSTAFLEAKFITHATNNEATGRAFSAQEIAQKFPVFQMLLGVNAI